MDNMKLLQYAYDAAITKWYRYNKIATAYAGQKAEPLAKKLAAETMADVNAIAEMIRTEESNLRLAADVKAQMKKLGEMAAAEKAPQKKTPLSPYVIVIKWNNPIGEKEYPCKNREEAEKAFEAAKQEVHKGNAIEAYVYDQTDGERYPVMGIIGGKL